MEFIEIYSNLSQREDFNDFGSIFLQKILDEHEYAVHWQNKKDFQIISLITRVQDFLIPCKIKIKQQSYLSIAVTFFQNYIVKFRTLHSKGIMIRQFLTLNNRIIRHFLHPITGELILSFNMAFCKFQSAHQELIQTLSVIINKIMQYSINQCKNICRFVIMKNESMNYNQSRQLQRLKKIIKTSPYYAFNVLKSTTHSREQHKLYEDLKKEFIQMNKYEKKNQFIKLFTQILNVEDQPIKPYQVFTTEQQFSLKQKYIPKLQQHPKALLINQITLSQTNLQKLFSQQLTKLQCHQFGKIHVYLQSYPKSKIPALNYERQILSKLPKREYMGILKYYVIKNYKAITAHCIITNLTSGVRYYQFLQNNKNTISIFTKLHLLHQVSLILKYLTNHNIVYHNLQPKNLYIRKGLYVKATDFTNSFHDEVNLLTYKKQHIPWKSVLPYVSLYQYSVNNSYGDQKSDIFSLGMLMYETIYGKTPLFKKKGKQQDSYWVQKLLSPLIIGIEKKNEQQDKIIQILTYLMLECIRHQKISPQVDENNNIEQQDLINLKDRPYLDWMVISLKLIIQIYKKNYN